MKLSATSYFTSIIRRISLRYVCLNDMFCCALTFCRIYVQLLYILNTILKLDVQLRDSANLSTIILYGIQWGIQGSFWLPGPPPPRFRSVCFIVADLKKQYSNQN